MCLRNLNKPVTDDKADQNYQSHSVQHAELWLLCLCYPVAVQRTSHILRARSRKLPMRAAHEKKEALWILLTEVNS